MIAEEVWCAGCGLLITIYKETDIPYCEGCIIDSIDED